MRDTENGGYGASSHNLQNGGRSAHTFARWQDGTTTSTGLWGVHVLAQGTLIRTRLLGSEDEARPASGARSERGTACTSRPARCHDGESGRRA